MRFSSIPLLCQLRRFVVTLLALVNPRADAAYENAHNSYRCFHGICTECVFWGAPWKGKNVRLLCWSSKVENNFCFMKMLCLPNNGTAGGSGVQEPEVSKEAMANFTSIWWEEIMVCSSVIWGTLGSEHVDHTAPWQVSEFSDSCGLQCHIAGYFSCQTVCGS